MTSQIVEAILSLQVAKGATSSTVTGAEGNANIEEAGLSLESQSPCLGKPISHLDLLQLSRELKAHHLSPPTLDILLRGSRVYVPPPVPKPEPVSRLFQTLPAREMY